MRVGVAVSLRRLVLGFERPVVGSSQDEADIRSWLVSGLYRPVKASSQDEADI